MSFILLSKNEGRYQPALIDDWNLNVWTLKSKFLTIFSNLSPLLRACTTTSTTTMGLKGSFLVLNNQANNLFRKVEIILESLQYFLRTKSTDIQPNNASLFFFIKYSVRKLVISILLEKITYLQDEFISKYN